MEEVFMKPMLLALVSVTTLAFISPAHAAITLGSTSRFLFIPSTPTAPGPATGTFNQSISNVGSDSASQNSIIGLAVLPQFSGRGDATLVNDTSGVEEVQSTFSAAFTIPSGESYNYALTGNLSSSGTGFIDATGFDLANVANPNPAIVSHDAQSTFSENGLLGPGTYRINVLTRLIQNEGPAESVSATGS